jgi:hypothetical protein
LGQILRPYLKEVNLMEAQQIDAINEGLPFKETMPELKM